MRPAVFLDRDGTIIEERRLPRSARSLELYPFTADAIRLLNRAGYASVVVTNQAGIGRGSSTSRSCGEVHDTIEARLAAGGARIDAYYFCPHHPDGGGSRTTPEVHVPQARARHDRTSLPRAVHRSEALVHDRRPAARHRAGARGGARGILVRTGHGAQRTRPPDGVAADASRQPDAAAAGSRRSADRSRSLSDRTNLMDGRRIRCGESSAGRLLALIDAFPSRRGLVIGDVIADEFVYGAVARVSREAPVLILEYDSTRDCAGRRRQRRQQRRRARRRGRCSSASSARDPEGRRLLPALPPPRDRGRSCARRGSTAPGQDADPGGRHPLGQAAGRPHRSRRRRQLDKTTSARVGDEARPALDACDAVLVSDYGAGLVSPALADAVRRAAARCTRRRPVPILVDSRYRLLEYSGLTACTPNESEVEQALGIRINDDARALERAGRQLLGGRGCRRC